MEKKQISKKYQYDSLNRLVSVTDKDGRTQVYTYDPAGNRTMTTILEAGRGLSGIAKPVPEAPGPPVPTTPQLCGNCGTPVKSGKKFCSACGTPVSAPAPAAPVTAAPPPSSVCAACGNPIKPGAKFCAKCGRRRT